MTARETQQKAAEYLSKYRIANAEVCDIENRITRARAEMMSVRGISYEGGDMPKSPNHTGDLSDYVARIELLICQWQSAQRRQIAAMLEISRAINAVEPYESRRVLMLHFIDGKPYERIAETMHASANSVYRWRRKGLMQIKIPSTQMC